MDRCLLSPMQTGQMTDLWCQAVNREWRELPRIARARFTIHCLTPIAARSARQQVDINKLIWKKSFRDLPARSRSASRRQPRSSLRSAQSKHCSSSCGDIILILERACTRSQRDLGSLCRLAAAGARVRAGGRRPPDSHLADLGRRREACGDRCYPDRPELLSRKRHREVCQRVAGEGVSHRRHSRRFQLRMMR